MGNFAHAEQRHSEKPGSQLKNSTMKRTQSDSTDDIYTRLTLLVDNELSQEAENELLKEIKSNPDYADYLAKEKSFRTFIRARLPRRKASPDLLETLKEKIKIAPDTSFSSLNDDTFSGRK